MAWRDISRCLNANKAAGEAVGEARYPELGRVG